VTTSHSPISRLKAQAAKIAAMLKAAERGDTIDARFAEKIAAARGLEVFKVGIVMDDKVITIEMPWTMIRKTSEAGITEFILQRMRDAKDQVQ
jgi:hypothetical protein